MAPIRRLPVLQNAAPADEERPPWQWTLIGLLYIFCIWAPLAMVANWASRRIVENVVGDGPPAVVAERIATAPTSTQAALWLAVTGAPLLTYAFSCWGAGALLGKFGGKAGTREAATAGGLSALVGGGLSAGQAGLASSIAAVLVLAPLGLGTAWLGARFGKARRAAGGGAGTV